MYSFSTLSKSVINKAWDIVIKDNNVTCMLVCNSARDNNKVLASVLLANLQESFDDAICKVTTKDVYGDLEVIANEDGTYRIGCYDKNGMEVSLYNDHDDYIISDYDGIDE